MANLDADDLDALLEAPRVLGNLDVDLPSRVTLFEDLPDGLVAGNFLVIDGEYQGRAPKTVRVSGKYGRNKVRSDLRVHVRPGVPPAFAATTEPGADLGQLEAEGMVLPEWFSREMLRQSRSRIAQAGRGGTPAVGQLDAALIRRYLRTRVLPRARACYNRALARTVGQSGRVVLDIEIGKGEVMRARVGQDHLARTDPKFIECLTEAAWALEVPAGNLDGQVYRVNYPVSFVAPADNRGPSTDEGPDPVFQRLLDSADVLLRPD